MCWHSAEAPPYHKMITVVRVADNAVAIFNVDGRLFAIDDSCLRCGASLASGALRGRHVSCSRCDWQYDVITGCVHGVPRLRIDRFEVKIVNSQVLVASAAMPLSSDKTGDGRAT